MYCTLPREEVGHPRRAALVGDLYRVDAGHEVEHRGGEALGRRGTEGREVERARLRLAERDELLRRFRRHARVDHEDQRREPGLRDRGEVPDRIVGVVLHEGGRHHEHRGCEPERIAVLGRGGDHLHADGVAASAPVLDQHRLFESLRKLLRHVAGDDIGATPRGVRDDDLDGLARVVGLRVEERGEREAKRGSEAKSGKFHRRHVGACGYVGAGRPPFHSLGARVHGRPTFHSPGARGRA